MLLSRINLSLSLRQTAMKKCPRGRIKKKYAINIQIKAFGILHLQYLMCTSQVPLAHLIQTRPISSAQQPQAA